VTSPALSDAEFAQLRTLIERESGIHLGPAKRGLLLGRLARRVRELGLESFGAYHRHVVHGPDPAELDRLLDRICTNETRFFREPRHLAFLERQVFPAWLAAAAAGQRERRIRAWSAACSSGEEPFSVAMALLDRFPPAAGWSVEVLGTDLSTTALARARAATWPLAQAREIPDDYLHRFMLRGRGRAAGTMRATPALRSVVRFARVNLSHPVYPVERDGGFDLILCRNVLIYFAAPARAVIAERLAEYLAPDGLLVLGHVERLSAPSRLRAVGPTLYRRAVV
jgi:chemotaxis protein methyltransferase CheR